MSEALDNTLGERAPGECSVAARITDALRKDLLQRSAGEFLGSEEELLAGYQVSRPTFRQVARILEQEQLLLVKRGIGGGYYVRRPSVETVGRAVASYLQSRNTSIEQLFQASEPTATAISRLASLSDDSTAREAFATHASVLAHADVLRQSVDEFMRQDQRHRALLARLAGNPVLELMLDTLALVAASDAQRNTFEGDSERRLCWQKLRGRLADAILAREPDVAAALAVRMHDVILGWRREDAAAAAKTRQEKRPDENPHFSRHKKEIWR